MRFSPTFKNIPSLSMLTLDQIILFFLPLLILILDTVCHRDLLLWYWLIDYGANGASYYLTYLCAWNNGYFSLYLDKLRIFSALVHFVSQCSVVCALADDTDRTPGWLPAASLDVRTTRGHKTSSYPRQGTGELREQLPFQVCPAGRTSPCIRFMSINKNKFRELIY